MVVIRPNSQGGLLAGSQTKSNTWQQVGSWPSFLGYTLAGSVIVWIAMFTNSIFLPVAAMNTAVSLAIYQQPLTPTLNPGPGALPIAERVLNQRSDVRLVEANFRYLLNLVVMDIGTYRADSHLGYT